MFGRIGVTGLVEGLRDGLRTGQFAAGAASAIARARIRRFSASRNGAKTKHALAYGAYVPAATAALAVTVWGTVGVMGHLLEAVDGMQASYDDQFRVEAPLAPVKNRLQSGFVPSQDEWHERLRARDFWASRQTSPDGSWSTTGQPQVAIPSASRSGAEDGTYRTVCVRLCDGYYWPISYSTTTEHLERDTTACESSCNAPAHLFVQKSPNADPEGMVSLAGVPYTKLKTAFLFRTKYDASCKCKPHAWDQEAKDRHRVYALEAAPTSTVGSAKDVENAQELAMLKARVAAAEVANASTKEAESARARSELAALAKGATPLLLSGRPARRVRFADDGARDAKSRESRANGFEGFMGLGSGSGGEQPSSRRGYRPEGGDWRQKVFSGTN